MSANAARIGAISLFALAIVLILLALTNDNGMWLALSAVFCALAGGWVGMQAPRSSR